VKGKGKVLLWAVFAVYVFSVATQLFWEGIPAWVPLVLFSFGAMMLAYALRVIRHGDEPKHDERTRKLGAFAASWSWFLTLLAISVLFWLDYLEIFRFSSQELIGFTLFFMVFTMIAFRWHLARKGDLG